MLNQMPLRGGLATAGQRDTINEGQLWKAENFYPALDGMLQMRPGTQQHGQTIITVATGTTNYFHELFQTVSAWDIDTTGTDANYGVNNGQLNINISSGTAAYFTHNDSTSTGGDYSFRFTARFANIGGDASTTGGNFRFILSGDGGTTNHEYVFKADGIYNVVSSTDTLVVETSYNVDLGGYHTYEFYYDSSADTTAIWVDGVLSDTVDMSAADNATFNGASGATVEFWLTTDTDTWSAQLTDMMFSDTVYDADDLPFQAQTIQAVGVHERILTGGISRTSLLCASTNKLYIDDGVKGVWTPSVSLYSGPTFFASFRSELLIFDDSGETTARLYKWDGVNTPSIIADAPPVRFGAVYRQRVWAAGDRNWPLRAYFTASFDPEVWFAPEYDPDETFEEVTEAGYINIDSVVGDEITNIYGDFFHNLIVQTRRSLWRVTGSSPQTYQVENISRQVGGSSPNGAVQYGNELMTIGAYGVVAVNNAATSGNLQTHMPSAAIGDKWSNLPNVESKIDKAQLKYAFAESLPSLNLLLIGMRGQGQSELTLVYALSTLNNQWYGPWDMSPTCFTRVEYGVPVQELLLAGHGDGTVTVTGIGLYTDKGSTYTCKLASPIITGRSLDPTMVGKVKTWRCLRLFVHPQVSQTFTLRWKTDFSEFDSVELSQNPDGLASLSDDFRLNVDRIYSTHDTVVIEQLLDDRGTHFQFDIESDYPLVIQGYQLEFTLGPNEDG